jgi:hypothetical protein
MDETAYVPADSVAFIPLLRCGRLYLLQLASLLVFAIAVLISPVPADMPVLAILGVATLLFPVILTTAFHRVLSCRISARGIETSFGLFGGHVSWAEPSRVSSNSLLVTVHASLQRFCVLPRQWLVRDPAAYTNAILNHAPVGHPIRRFFTTSTELPHQHVCRAQCPPIPCVRNILRDVLQSGPLLRLRRDSGLSPHTSLCSWWSGIAPWRPHARNRPRDPAVNGRLSFGRFSNHWSE